MRDLVEVCLCIYTMYCPLVPTLYSKRVTVFVYTLARSCEEGEEVLRCWERGELSSDWLEEGVEVGGTRCHTLHSLLLLPGYRGGARTQVSGSVKSTNTHGVTLLQYQCTIGWVHARVGACNRQLYFNAAVA